MFLFQFTNPVASLFISLHHNVSGADPNKELPQGESFLYEAGWKDACAVFFYSLVCIVMHGILQEYVLDVSTNHHYNCCIHSSHCTCDCDFCPYSYIWVWAFKRKVNENGITEGWKIWQKRLKNVHFEILNYLITNKRKFGLEFCTTILWSLITYYLVSRSSL